jgi:hypothetical protein
MHTFVTACSSVHSICVAKHIFKYNLVFFYYMIHNKCQFCNLIFVTMDSFATIICSLLRACYNLSVTVDRFATILSPHLTILQLANFATWHFCYIGKFGSCNTATRHNQMASLFQSPKKNGINHKLILVSTLHCNTVIYLEKDQQSSV